MAKEMGITLKEAENVFEETFPISNPDKPAQIEKLKQQRDKGLLTEAEYQTRKALLS